MPVIPSGFAQVNFRYSGEPHPTGAEWTLGLKNTAAMTAQEIADEMVVREAFHFSPLRVEDSVFSEAFVKLGPNDTGPTASATAAIPGGSAAEGIEPNTAVLVTRNTGLGGRHGRGRIFFPATNDNTFNQAGLMGAVSLGLYQDAFDAFWQELNTAGLEPVLLHADATAPTIITSFAVQARAATQRRRLRR